MNKPVSRAHSRRHVLFALGSLPVFASCGGGGGGGGASPPPADGPVIDSFAADNTHVFVGDETRLVATFRGGSGVLLPGGAPVTSGVPVPTGALAQTTAFTLRVQSPGSAAVERSITIDVSYRDRYVAAPVGISVSQHTTSNARDGSLIVIGGSRGVTTLSDSIDRFDPATRTFRAIGALAVGRAQHRACVLPQGGILVVGGMRSSGDSRIAERVNDLTGRSDPAGAMSVARTDHAIVALPDGRVFVSGGYSTGEHALLGVSASAEIWNPADSTFRRLTSAMWQPRAAHSATVLPNGKVLLAGGYTSASAYRFAEIFDPATETFSPVAGDAVLRASHVAHATPDDRVLLIGGETLADDGLTAIPLASALAYDAATGTLAVLPGLSRPRTWAASVGLPSGEVLLFGGQEEPTKYSACAERYNPASGGVPIAGLDGGRALHTANRLPDGRVALIGGEAVGGAYRTTVQVYE